MKLKDLKTNAQNPRYLTDADFQKLLNKILTFPRLLEKNKITFDSEQGNTILGGNMRFKALNYICDTYTRENIFEAIKTAQNALNIDNADLMEESVTVFTQMIEKRSLPENWVQDAKGLSEEEKNAFVIIDNVSDGDWDFDVLANGWDIELSEWGLVDWSNDTEQQNEQDYSDKNNEYGEDDFNDLAILKLEFTLEDYELVKSELLKHGQTPEDAIFKLLNLKPNE